MRGIFSPADLARMSSRHPWRTIGVWLMILALAIVASGALTGRLTNDIELTNNPDSQVGARLLEERLRGEEPLTETVVIQSSAYTVDDEAMRSVVEATTADLLQSTDLVESASNYYTVGATDETAAASLVSDDGHTTLIPVVLVDDEDYVTEHASEYVELVDSHTTDEVRVLSVGSASGTDTYDTIGEEDLVRAENIGLPLTLVILTVVFGALVAAGLPVLLGLVTIMVAMGLTGIASLLFDLNSQVTTIITMIGLAVGIDYALFVIQRYREERRRGLTRRDAIERAGGTAGKAVLFSGLTVVIALMGMFAIPVSIFQNLAIGAATAVVVAVLATQTLIPALLALLGDRIDWPRRRAHGTAAAAGERPQDEGTIHRGLWGSITRVVMARPARFATVGLVALLLMTVPYGDMRTGQAGIETLPESDVKTAYEILDEEFYAGIISPVEIVIDGDAADPAVAQGVDRLVTTLGEDPLYGAATVTTNDAGDLTLVSVPLGADASSDDAFDAVDRLRDSVIPGAFGDAPADVLVSGSTAETRDFNAILADYTPVVFAIVLGLSFLLLALAFRSIVVPATAIVMNLLSVGAAYGMLVMVFQWGIGAHLFGFVETPQIEAWIPIFLFSILFGLSMDYHVFLLSRIREHYDVTGRNTESVAVGLQATGRIITGAALIMVAVFAAFASGRMVTIQQMGFGLAVAVFLDATIVRSLLVPSIMRLLGDRNWYMPRALRWLPDLRIEGEPAPVQQTIRSGAAD